MTEKRTTVTIDPRLLEKLKNNANRITDRNEKSTYITDLEETVDGPDLMEELNPAGISRPTLNGWPVPWSGGLGPEFGSWGHVTHERAYEAETKRLCIVCGTGLGDNYVYANFLGERYDQMAKTVLDKMLGLPPTPTFVHVRCLLKAAAFCPFLGELSEPGLDQHGKPLTRDDLRALLKGEKSDVHRAA